MNTVGSNPSRYNAYLDFFSGANGIKNQIALNYATIKAIEVAKCLLTPFSDVFDLSDLSMEISLKARQLSNKAYFECKGKLEKKYSDSIYQFVLKAYLPTIQGYFENSLNNDIKTKIRETVEKQIKKQADPIPSSIQSAVTIKI